MTLDKIANGIPVCRDLDEALAVADEPPDYFIYGMAPASDVLSQSGRNLGV